MPRRFRTRSPRTVSRISFDIVVTRQSPVWPLGLLKLAGGVVLYGEDNNGSPAFVVDDGGGSTSVLYGSGSAGSVWHERCDRVVAVADNRDDMLEHPCSFVAVADNRDDMPEHPRSFVAVADIRDDMLEHPRSFVAVADIRDDMRGLRRT